MTYGKRKTNIEPNKTNKERKKLKKQSKILLSWVTMDHHSKIEILPTINNFKLEFSKVFPRKLF